MCNIYFALMFAVKGDSATEKQNGSKEEKTPSPKPEAVADKMAALSVQDKPADTTPASSQSPASSSKPEDATAER